MSEQDFIIENGVLVEYTGTDENVIIPDGINEIAHHAFFSKETIKSVVIPDGVEKIGRAAFCKSVNLNSITIPDTVKEIGFCAFDGCRKLKRVVLPKGVEKIESSTFYCCKALKEVVLPESIKMIDFRAFYGCSALKSIVLPENLTAFGTCAFTGCKKLANEDGFLIVNGVLLEYFGASEDIVIPDNVEKIDGHFLKNKRRAKAVKSVTIPDSVKTIEDYAFHDFESLADENGFVIVRNVLYSYLGKEHNIVIPENVVKISSHVFLHNNRVTSVTLPEGIKEIGYEAFHCCEKLLQINIPESLTSIHERAFYRCEKLRRINLHKGVTEIGTEAFRYCEKLTIYAPEGSVAIEYAQNNNIAFKCQASKEIKRQVPEKNVNIDSLSKDEKIRMAIDAFETDVFQLDILMDDLGYNSAPYPSDDNCFYPCIGKKADIDAAYEFLDEVEKIINSKDLGFDKTDCRNAAIIVNEIKKEFKEIAKGKVSMGGSYGTGHIRTFVAVGLACYYFLSTETTMELVFNRDKWESSGDYCSSRKAAYRISKKDKGGKVLVKRYKAYDNFG